MYPHQSSKGKYPLVKALTLNIPNESVNLTSNRFVNLPRSCTVPLAFVTLADVATNLDSPIKDDEGSPQSTVHGASLSVT